MFGLLSDNRKQHTVNRYSCQINRSIIRLSIARFSAIRFERFYLSRQLKDFKMLETNSLIQMNATAMGCISGDVKMCLKHTFLLHYSFILYIYLRKLLRIN